MQPTVPLKDNIQLANNRKTSKYSAFITALEENRFQPQLFALEVGRLGFCPYPFLHCCEALGLLISAARAARQIRSEASKLPFALRMSFFNRGMPTWEYQAALY